MSKVTNVLVSGVGGQGTILASVLLSETALALGYDVKKSEVHGLAQRGGSVIYHIRFGKEVHSPTVPNGAGDFLISFELVEASRYAKFLSPDATILVNTVKIPSVTILAKLEKYPVDPLAGIRESVKECVEIPATEEAVKLGNQKAANVIMLGAYAARSGIDPEEFRKAIRRVVKPRFVELNLKAFEVGLGY